VLSLAKAKPLKLAAGKWKTVKVTVTNTGGTVVPQGSLRLKAPKGVVVRPGRQKLPSLLPGDSWTVSARVKLTAKAKAKSTVRLAASSGGLTAGGALVLTRTG
jgi:adhesin HecA-like repeat protein